MAESTLSISYTELLSEIGRYLGYGRDSGQWSAEECLDVDSIINSGLRQFYVPQPLSENDKSHSWSFLKPIDIITTAAGQSSYDLPDDFGGIEGDLTYEAGSGRQFVRIAGEGMVRSLQSSNSHNGVPSVVAIRPKASDGSSGQRFEIIFWKTPDSAYVLSYRKLALMSKLSQTNPYPLGGMSHGETILESCLSIAEQRLNDGQKGQHWNQFMTRLAASIMYDRRSFTPGFLGYNADRSDYSGCRARQRTTIVTYNGAEG